MAMEMTGVSIPEVYNSFVTVERLLPFAKEMQGIVNTKFTFSAVLDQEMMPVLNTLNAYGKLQSKEVTLVSTGVFDKIKSLLKLNEAYTNQLKDVNISFNIEDGNLKVQPFKVKAGPINMVVSGEQGLDRSVNYLLDMKIPREMLGKAANEAISGLMAKASGAGMQVELPEMIPVKARITGTLQKPKVGLDMKGSAGSSTEAVKEAVKQKAEEEVKKQVEKVEKKVDEEKEELKAEADAKAEAFLKEAAQKRDEAIAAAARERDKILKKADEMEKNAKGTVVEQMKIKAEARAMRKAANKAYEKAVQVANDQYKKAEQKAEEMRQDVKEL
jgi:hypothetical protein